MNATGMAENRAGTGPPTVCLPGTPWLVIGFGNTLRGDDAIGPRVAAAVARWKDPDLLALAVPQLTPELAEPIAKAGAVVFVDAIPYPEATEVQTRRLEMPEGDGLFTHQSDPAGLMGLARAVYGCCPPAWLLTVPAASFHLGNGLSSSARRGLRRALRSIRQIRDAMRLPKVIPT